MPRVEDIMVPWSRIKNHTEPSLLLEQTYQDSCTGNYYLVSTFFLSYCYQVTVLDTAEKLILIESFSKT